MKSPAVLTVLLHCFLAYCLKAADANMVRVGTGSGFFITSDGYFVTNNHVVEEADSVTVKVGNIVYPTQIIKTDEINDLAILKLDGEFSCIPLGEDLVSRPGEDVFTVGFPMTDVMGEAPKTTLGTLSAVTGIEDDPRTFQISVQIQPGNSGGPLVQKNTGNVIGVTFSSLSAARLLQQSKIIPQNVNYAIKSSYIRPLISTVPELVNKLPKIFVGDRPWREVQQAVENSVGLVAVYKTKSHAQQVRQQAPPPNASQNQGVWIFPDSSLRNLMLSEVSALNAEDLWRARNEIYARNGLIFTTPRGKAFAESLGDDYRGLDADQNRILGRMNKIERFNLELIKSVEISRR